jgi:exopolysaccharide production protein ExoQ
MRYPSTRYREEMLETRSRDGVQVGRFPYLRRSRLAQAALLIYLFFVMFGTAMPFPDNSHEIAEKTTSNIVNQVMYPSLFFLSFWCLIPLMKQAMMVMWREKCLTLLLLWVAVSLLWSEVASVSIKRIVRLATAVTVSLTALLYARESKDTLRTLLSILTLYLLSSLLAILLIPEAVDPSSNTWRGMALSKNHFGQAMVVSVVAWCLALRHDLVRRRTFAILMAALSVALLVGSSSITASLTLGLLAVAGALWWLSSAIMPPIAAKCFYSLGVFFFFVPVAIAYASTPEIFDPLFLLIERNASFTGRTDLWSFVWEHASDQLMYGCGYGAFWTTANADLLTLYDSFVWLPNQSHMGYLDILNELGLVGIVLFACMLGAYLWRLQKTTAPQIWVWFVAAALIINTQESTLFRPSVLTGVMFLHGYLAITVDKLKVEGAI